MAGNNYVEQHREHIQTFVSPVSTSVGAHRTSQSRCSAAKGQVYLPASSVETARPVTPSAPCTEFRVGGSKTEPKLHGALALGLHNPEMGEEQPIIDGVILASTPRFFDTS